MIKKILAPTDLSSFSRAGVRYALNKARASGAEVIIYHVFKVEDLRHLGERLTDHAVRAAGSSTCYKIIFAGATLILRCISRKILLIYFPWSRCIKRWSSALLIKIS